MKFLFFLSLLFAPITSATNNVVQEETLVEYSANDFILFWNDNVRINDEFDPCNDVSADLYNEIIENFNKLSEEEQYFVRNSFDKKNQNIGDVLDILKSQHSSNASFKKKKTNELDEKTALTLVSVISIVGMTSICVFYMLKTKKLIK